METVKINLADYKRGTIFTGRPQGYQVRKDLDLDKIDRDANRRVEFVIPEDTTSFNPSFFLGLLYESIKSLGLDRFKRKYNFITDNVRNKSEIESNLQDGIRNATNFIDPSSTLSVFLR